MVQKREPESDYATRPDNCGPVARYGCVVIFYRLFFSRIIRKISITRRVTTLTPSSLSLPERGGVRVVLAHAGRAGVRDQQPSPCALAGGEGFLGLAAWLSP